MSAEVVPLSVVGDPHRIEPLVRRVFGQGNRAPGWFHRKLYRECVDAALSRLATTGDPTDPQHWLGYVLVGTPPSLGDTARTCGGGVIASMRHRGIGRRLFAAAARAAADVGHTRLRVPATGAVEGWFRSMGYEHVRGLVTMLAFGTGTADTVSFGAPERWDPSHGLAERAGWLCEAWERTDASGRATVHLDGIVIHASREGAAVLAHRVLAAPDLDADAVAHGIDRLRASIATPTPLLVAGLDPVSSVTTRLDTLGWSAVQRAACLERSVP